jgi:RNA polymerase sigma factor (sigma-70 family)
MTLLIERRELLERFRAGQRSALEEVYRHYVTSVQSFLSRGFTFRSGDQTLRFAGYTQPFDLDNAIQETFARAFRETARMGYDGLHPYKNYILAIARNFVVDQLRSRDAAMLPLVDAAGSGVEEDDGPAAEHGEPAPGAEQELLRSELGRLYAAFVAELGERDRTFFRARFEEQRSQVEAGRLSGLSHMQARTLEKKLRKRFLAFMQARGYLEAYSLTGGRGATDGMQ